MAAVSEMWEADDEDIHQDDEDRYNPGRAQAQKEKIHEDLVLEIEELSARIAQLEAENRELQERFLQAMEAPMERSKTVDSKHSMGSRNSQSFTGRSPNRMSDSADSISLNRVPSSQYLNDKEEEIHDLRQQLQNTQASKEEQEQLTARLQKAITSAEKARKADQGSIAELRDKLAQLTTSLTEMQQQQSTLNSEKQASNQLIALLREELAASEAARSMNFRRNSQMSMAGGMGSLANELSGLNDEDPDETDQDFAKALEAEAAIRARLQAEVERAEKEKVEQLQKAENEKKELKRMVETLQKQLSKPDANGEAQEKEALLQQAKELQKEQEEALKKKQKEQEQAKPSTVAPPMIFSGWLGTKGQSRLGLLRPWSNRFFILENGKLRWWSSQEHALRRGNANGLQVDENIRGSLDFVVNEVVVLADSEDQFKFSIRPADKSLWPEESSSNSNTMAAMLAKRTPLRTPGILELTVQVAVAGVKPAKREDWIKQINAHINFGRSRAAAIAAAEARMLGRTRPEADRAGEVA